MLMEIARAIFVYVHLLCFAGVFPLVLWCDYTIIKHGVHCIPIEKIKLATVIFLLALWLSGLIIVFIDTQFQFHVITQKPKLILKLLCVFVLTLNGFILHSIAFKMLTDSGYLSHSQAIVLSASGAMSTTNWFVAVFVGSANLLNQFSISWLLSGYLCGLLIALGVAVSLGRNIQMILNKQRAAQALEKLNLSPQL